LFNPEKSRLFANISASYKWKRPIAAGLHAPPAGIQGHSVFVFHSTIYVIGGATHGGVQPLSQVRMLKLINPSERKPIVEHLLTDFCAKVSFF